MPNDGIVKLYTQANYAYLKVSWDFDIHTSVIADSAATKYLPKETADLIMNVGLPKDIDRVFDLTFEPFPEQFTVSVYWDRTYVLLGRFFNAAKTEYDPLALNTATGNIHRLWPDFGMENNKESTNERVQFINCSLTEFLICSMIYERYIPSLERLAKKKGRKDLWASLSEEEFWAVSDCVNGEFEAVLRAIRNEISEVDPKAFEKDDRAYFWPSLIYEWNL